MKLSRAGMWGYFNAVTMCDMMTGMAGVREKLGINSGILTRAVEEVIVKEHLQGALKSGRELRVKFGIDPTSPDLHLGHSVPLRKLRAFQNAGHRAVLIIGDFTATVGDPSGRNEARRPLSEKEVHANMKTYLRQAGKIIDLKKTEVRHNSEWYKNTGAAFLYDLMSKVTVQQATERDDFRKRLKQGRDISVLEVVYPLLQGYDSVAVRADVEIGGSDQKFNLLMGRKIQRRYGMEEQDILTTWLIEGTDGVRKMSKSLGNYIGLEEKPGLVFGKLMSVPDDLMVKYFIALTDVPLSEIEEIREGIRLGKLNPRDAKLRLSETIVSMYFSPKTARRERESFLKIFSRRELPDKIPQKKLHHGMWSPAELLVESGLAESKSEARRLFRSGAVSINGTVLRDASTEIQVNSGTLIKVGKRKFLKVW